VIWDDVPIGGGGYITNLRYFRRHSLAFAGTDVHNCYLRREGDKRWATVFRRDTMRPEDMVRTVDTNTKGHGIASSMLDLAGTDGTRAYGHINAHVYTIDLDPSISLRETGGIKCRKWNLSAKYMQPNLGWSKMFGNGIAGHPTDPNVAAVGTWNDGVYYTLDGGNNVHQVDVFPGSGGYGTDKGRERYLVAFGPDGTFYVFVQGLGLHRAASVTDKPQLIPGSPPRAAYLTVENDGTVLLCGDPRLPNAAGTDYQASPVDQTIAGVWVLDGRDFRNLGNGLRTWGHAYPVHVARNPLNPDHMMVWHEQVGAITFDGGETWGTAHWNSPVGIEGGEAPWRNRKGLFLGGGFDYTNTPGELMGGEGFGVIRMRELIKTDRSDGLTWAEPAKDYSAGIEEFIVNYIWVNPANGRTFLNCWDRHVVEINDLDDYTADVMHVQGERLSIAHGMDNAIDDPEYYVVSAGTGTPAHGWSQGGKEWFSFAPTSDQRKVTYPDKAGNGSAGAVAMSTRDDIVICQSNNLGAIESRGSRVFRQIKLNGSTNYSTINSYTTAYRKNVSADKTRPGVFAMLVPMTDPSVRNSVANPLGGLWVRDGIGAEWVQNYKGRLGSYGETAQFWNCDLFYIPGHSGELLYTGYIGQANAPLVHLLEDGRRSVEVKRVRNVTKFGFGANPGGGYPAVMFLGEWQGERGYWQTTDWFKTAEKLSDEYPNGYWSPGCSSIAGDMTTPGRWFVAVSGKGAVFTGIL
jgi:hypothetical protein